MASKSKLVLIKTKDYLNPENTVPNAGLTSLGISVPLGQGLFINQRMADLRKAKMQMHNKQSVNYKQLQYYMMHLLLILIGKKS
jgi:hypothetical protein